MKKEENQLMEKIVALCKRRGFIFPGSEIYGGLANSFDYGPLGVELKNNIKQLWWKKFVQERDDMVGIDAALIMNPKVWQSSGHLKNFSDPLVECKKCHHRFRADKIEGTKCPDCKGELTQAQQFNLMLKTFLGPVESAHAGGEKNNEVYFRPETAQAMFVDFKNVLDSTRVKIPFGISQIGKAFRNEITPGNFIFRTREFEQMEIEYFIRPQKASSQNNTEQTQINAEENDWEYWFEDWRKEMWSWMTDILGLKKESIHELEVPKDDLAHYSKKTIDFEYEFPFGKDELYGLAYRTDFDLRNHYKEEPYADQETGEKFYPHVIEPTFGVDRSVLAVLSNAYQEEEERIVLKLKPSLAPYKAAIFPLVKNKPELVGKAKEVYAELRKDFRVTFDDRGNIGKRYYSQDEIGTPYCITVDYDTLENDDVTIRDRDTMKQERIKISELKNYLLAKIYV